MAVGIVFVSHSSAIAEGLVALARQMAPTAPLSAAGGTDEGGIGTSFTKVQDGIRAVDAGDGVVLIGDLGSAILTAETAVELLEEVPAGGVRVLDVPLVEGGVAAAVAAEAGGDLAAVVRAAGGEDDGPAAEQPATQAQPRPPAEPAPPAQPAPTGQLRAGSAEGRITLADPAGLHARPAADVVRTAARFDSRVTLDGTDAASLLGLLALGRKQGAEVVVRADGDDADAALAAVLEVLSHIG